MAKETAKKVYVQGAFDPKFYRIFDAFEEALNDPKEYGMHFALYLEGKLVVDLWGGYQDEERTVPFEFDTMTNMWSVGKGLCSFPLLILADEGEIELDAPMSKYWPGFEKNGKEGVKVWMGPCHMTGIGTLPAEAGDAFDWCKIIKMLEEAPAEHGVGEAAWAIQYQGHLAGEPVRIVTGRTVGEFWREEIAEPFGLDYYFGLSRQEQVRACDNLDNYDSPFLKMMRDYDTNYGKSVLACPFTPEYVNSSMYKAVEIPSHNSYGTARGLARFYMILANEGQLDGQRLISKEMLDYAREVAWVGPDKRLEIPFTVTKCGCELEDGKGFYFDGNPGKTFGSLGMNENVGFANIDGKYAVGFSRNVIMAGGDRTDNYMKIMKSVEESFR